MIRVCRYAPDGDCIKAEGAEALSAAIESGTPVWVDMEAFADEELDALGRAFALHPLAVEDCRHTRVRPKIEDYDGLLFIVFHGIVGYDREGGIQTAQLQIFVGPTFNITVHDVPIPALTRLRQEETTLKRVLSQGPVLIAHHVLDGVVDDYLPAVDGIEDHLEELEEAAIEGREAIQAEVMRVRRSVVILRQLALPQRELLFRLYSREHSMIPSETVPYYRDIYDHMLRVGDLLELLRDRLDSVVEIHLASISNAMNRSMQHLSIVATMMLPLGVVTGIFGMNFVKMPLIEHPYGFAMVGGVMGVIVISMYMLFRRKHVV